MLSDAAQQALSILRDGNQFTWYVITLFAFVVYVYAVEIERRNWSLVFAGLAYWGMDWFNEIWNSLILHYTHYAPAWSAPGDTAFLILVGLNIEICFMFAVAGVAFGKMLPSDPKLKVLGIPNRIFLAVTGSIVCVIIEIWLNSIGVLVWDLPWWNLGAPWLIFLVGYLPFFLVSFWVHDMKTIRSKLITVGAIYAVYIIGILVFGVILGWL
jgi:hypothetical protein